MAKSKTLGYDDIEAAINRLAESISLRHPTPRSLILLGIANGGLELTRRLAAKLGVTRTGTIDISFHRDDIGLNPIPKELVPTCISTDVQGATVILVDDVLFSGRTVKAALNELFDHGRPGKVELAVLVDRGGRKLPVAPDYAGLILDPDPADKVVVRLDPTTPQHDFIRIETSVPKIRHSISETKTR
ncbi:MAG: bifunctional pyr operon transcriptional regulator/uracil phosphoribosyltransferase PyrR [Cephaloticoccus sp.]|nr:bifunctional pyr operon transcriptional regulator/uracil phosphoribosyltransferase PyrR [Cephaloticoccus sp.]